VTIHKFVIEIICGGLFHVHLLFNFTVSTCFKIIIVNLLFVANIILTEIFL